MRHAIAALDEVRRRVQQQHLGHRGRAGDPLYKARKLLVMSATSADPELEARLQALLALGDPDGEVAFAYSLKEAVAAFYAMGDPEEAADFLRDIVDLASRPSSPFELKALARTLKNWFEPIVAWHEARVSNGPTEGMNNLLKRVNVSPSALRISRTSESAPCSTAGKPNFRVLDSIVVR